MFGGVHWKAWWIDNWDQSDNDSDDWHFAEDMIEENVEVATKESMEEELINREDLWSRTKEELDILDCWV